jgi:hypothetical protein
VSSPGPTNLGYELQESGRVTGPHSLRVLGQKAEIHVLRPSDLVRASVAEGAEPAPWTPIQDIPELHALLFPRRIVPKLSRAVAHESTTARTDAEQPATDVFELLRHNAARQREAEGELLMSMAPRSNKRLRDYIIVAVVLNVVVLVAGHFIGYFNPFLIGLFVMGNLGLAWTVFSVMDRY